MVIIKVIGYVVLFCLSTSLLADDAAGPTTSAECVGGLEYSGVSHQQVLNYVWLTALTGELPESLAARLERALLREFMGIDATMPRRRGSLVLWGEGRRPLTVASFLGVDEDQREEVLRRLALPQGSDSGEFKVTQISENSYRHAFHPLRSKLVRKDGRSVLQRQPSEQSLYEYTYRFHNNILYWSNSSPIATAALPETNTRSGESGLRAWLDFSLISASDRSYWLQSEVARMSVSLQRRNGESPTPWQTRAAMKQLHIRAMRDLLDQGARLESSIHLNDEATVVTAQAAASSSDVAQDAAGMTVRVRRLQDLPATEPIVDGWIGFVVPPAVTTHLQTLGRNLRKETAVAEPHLLKNLFVDSSEWQFAFQLTLANGGPQLLVACICPDPVVLQNGLIQWTQGDDRCVFRRHDGVLWGLAGLSPPTADELQDLMPRESRPTARNSDGRLIDLHCNLAPLLEWIPKGRTTTLPERFQTLLRHIVQVGGFEGNTEHAWSGRLSVTAADRRMNVSATCGVAIPRLLVLQYLQFLHDRSRPRLPGPRSQQ